MCNWNILPKSVSKHMNCNFITSYSLVRWSLLILFYDMQILLLQACSSLHNNGLYKLGGNTQYKTVGTQLTLYYMFYNWMDIIKWYWINRCLLIWIMRLRIAQDEFLAKSLRYELACHWIEARLAVFLYMM